MTETENPPEEGIPAGAVDYAKIIDELKAANIALVEKVNALEAKSKSYDEKISALSGEAAKANADQKAKEDAKSEIDAAYEAAMEKLGFKKKE
jgi:predicted nuclease with TOPRIM domain